MAVVCELLRRSPRDGHTAVVEGDGFLRRAQAQVALNGSA